MCVAGCVLVSSGVWFFISEKLCVFFVNLGELVGVARLRVSFVFFSSFVKWISDSLICLFHVISCWKTEDYTKIKFLSCNSLFFYKA